MTNSEPQQPLHVTRLSQRNWLLASSDWTQLPDSPLDDDTKKQWREYRQKLRDFDYMDDSNQLPLKPGHTPQECVTPSPTPLPAGQ